MARAVLKYTIGISSQSILLHGLNTNLVGSLRSSHFCVQDWFGFGGDLKDESTRGSLLLEISIWFGLILCLVFIPRDHVFLKCGHFKKHCGAYGETIFLAEILLVQPVGNIFYRWKLCSWHWYVRKKELLILRQSCPGSEGILSNEPIGMFSSGV